MCAIDRLMCLVWVGEAHGTEVVWDVQGSVWLPACLWFFPASRWKPFISFFLSWQKNEKKRCKKYVTEVFLVFSAVQAWVQQRRQRGSSKASTGKKKVLGVNNLEGTCDPFFRPLLWTSDLDFSLKKKHPDHLLQVWREKAGNGWVDFSCVFQPFCIFSCVAKLQVELPL